MARPWIKLYTEALNDPEMMLLTDGAYRRFIELLLFAGEVDDNGRVGPISHICVKCNVSAKIADEQLDELQAAGMIHLNDNIYYVSNWHKRQPKSTTNDRVKAHRERKKDTKKETPPQKDGNR